MTAPRWVLALVAALLALVLQAAVLTQVSWLSWHGVVPNLVLLVVVGAGLVGGSQTGMTLGFVAGLLLDLAPPADHVAGRWALALLLAGWVAGRVRAESTFSGATDAPALRRGLGGPGRDGADRAPRLPRLPQALATVAGCSLVASSVFAVTGLVLRDPATGVSALLPVVAAGVALDVAALVIVPLLVLLVRRPGNGAGGRDRRTGRGQDRVLA